MQPAFARVFCCPFLEHYMKTVTELKEERAAFILREAFDSYAAKYTPQATIYCSEVSDQPQALLT